VTGWFKSSRSSAGGENCVEVRIDDVIGVRDSKNASGPVFVFGSADWRSFLEAAKAGDFDLR